MLIPSEAYDCPKGSYQFAEASQSEMALRGTLSPAQMYENFRVNPYVAKTINKIIII